MCLHVIEELHAICEINSPAFRLDVVCRDPDHNRILEFAVDAGAQAVVSGDPHLLALEEYDGIRIVSPAEFLKALGG